MKQLQILAKAFPISLELSEDMLCVNSLPKFLLGKTTEGRAIFLPYTLSVTQAIYTLRSHFLRTLLFWREGSFCLLFVFISVQGVAN